MAEHPPQPYRSPPSAYILVVGFAATALVGLSAARSMDPERAGLISAAAFASVLTASMLISWGAEAAQFFLSQGLAVALIALLQVMPEFMVEAVIAWHGEVRNMFANATGSNRLLIGLGWPLIYFTAEVSQRRQTGRRLGHVQLRDENSIEVLSLFVASTYYVKMLLWDALTIFDGVLLVLMYVGYMWLLSRLPEEGDESKDDLIAPARMLAEIRSPVRNRFVLMVLFLIGGGVMAFVSSPFVDSLKRVAGSIGVSEFDFIQWVAPFLSEFPENVTAVYWSSKVRLAPMAMINLISSTVSQFTLLVGMIPLVYAVSWGLGHFQAAKVSYFGLPVVPMALPGEGHDIRAEVMLSWAMTVLGCAQLAKLRFTMGNASLLLALWVVQFLSPAIQRWTGAAESTQHACEGVACLVLAVVELLRHWRALRFSQALSATLALMRRHTEVPPAGVPMVEGKTS